MTRSVIVVTYNSRHWVDGCLGSVDPQLRPDDELIVVDNGSTDGTVAYVKDRYPRAIVVQQENRGYGAACNAGARMARGSLLVFLNPDTQNAPGALENLAAAVGKDTLATPQLLLMDDPTRTNTRGLDLHFTGIGMLRGFGEPALPDGPPYPVPGITGAAFATGREDFLRLGGFDEGIFLYAEDVELSWRAQAAGWTVLLAPTSRVWHSYAPRHSAHKMVHLESGRRLLVRKYWTRAQRRLYLPSLAVLAILSFLARRGRRARVSPRALAVGGGRDWRTWTCCRLRVPGAGPAQRMALAIANAVFRLNARLAGGPAK